MRCTPREPLARNPGVCRHSAEIPSGLAGHRSGLNTSRREHASVVVSPSASRIWEAALGRLQIQVNRPSYDTWLRESVGLALEEGVLVVGVPTTFAAEWLERRLRGVIEEALGAVAPAGTGITFRVQGQAAEPMPMQASVVAPPPAAIADPTGADGGMPLNPRYTFGAFVVGGASQLAYAAARAVAEAPGAAYNPLFIYGGVGLGKTHLLHAVAQHAAAAGKHAVYLTTEAFTNEFLTAIRERRADAFRERYRRVDLLALDDIQFLSGKESTQEAFFHTFNALHDAGHQVVIASDRRPAALPMLEERLRSRFEWGLLVDVGTPDLETRTAILQAHAARSRVPVPESVIEYLAQRILSNVRQLEGALNRLTALAELTGTAITVERAAEALGASTMATSTPASPRAAIASVAAAFGTTPAALLSKRRDKAVTQARQVAVHVLTHALGLSATSVGEALGNRDRTTVLYALKQIQTHLDADLSLATQVGALMRAFTNGAPTHSQQD
ncbi:MAG: chromosomal replication initiator protein DnaA [Chloroflexota bacterium]